MAPGGDPVQAPLTPAALSSTGRLVRSSAAVGLGTMLSRLTGLVRVVVLLRVLGGGGVRFPLAESYNLANTTPNMVYDLLLGGILSATLVPVFVDLVRDDDDEGISAVVTIAVSALVALTAVTVVAAPWIFRIYTAGKDPATAHRLASTGVPLLRFFLPQILFYGLTALATALLNARRSFLAPAFAPVLNNVVVVAMLLALPTIAGGAVTLRTVLADKVLLTALGAGTTAGIVAMTVVLVPALRRSGGRLRVNFDWHHPALRRVLNLSGWTLGYVVVNQLAFVVITNLATRVSGVTFYANGFAFFQLPYALFAVSIMTTFSPDLAAAASGRDFDGFRRRFMLGMRLLLLVITPAAAGCFVLARPLLGAVTLVGGSFKPAEAAVTGDVLGLFALGLIGFSVYLYTLRAFYALKNTRFPFFAAVLQNGMNVLIGLTVFGRFGVQGLAFAYSLSYSLAAIAALAALRYRLRRLDAQASAPMIVRTGMAALFMALWVALLARHVGGPFGSAAALRVGVGVAAGAALLWLALTVLRVREVAELTRRLRARVPGL